MKARVHGRAARLLAACRLAGALLLVVGAGAGECEEPPSGPAGPAFPRTALSLSLRGAWTTAGFLPGVHEAGRATAIVELDLRRTLWSRNGKAVEYVAGLVPMELALGTVTVPASNSPDGRVAQSTVYGAGLDPLSFAFRVDCGGWRPFAAVRGGFRIFDRNVPNPRGTRFNFVAEVGVGVQRRAGASHWVWLGVDLHHVSNGDLGERNPGINSFVLGLGVVRSR